jgi:hypothetical protein
MSRDQKCVDQDVWIRPPLFSAAPSTALHLPTSPFIARLLCGRVADLFLAFSFFLSVQFASLL